MRTRLGSPAARPRTRSARRGSRLRPPAFVLGLGENGYAMARSLAAAGVPVVGFYREAAESGRWSRFCSSQRIPPGLDEEAVCRLLIEQAGRFAGTPVLIPTSDEYALLVAAHARALSRQFLFHWNEPGLLETIVDKSRMARACREADIAAPASRATVMGEDVDALAREVTYPCLVKPNRSFRVPFPEGRKNFVAQTARQLREFFGKHPDLLGNTLCQEVVAGGDDGIFQCNVLVGTAGSPAGIVSVRKLRQYPPGYGVMCHGRSEANAEVEVLALRLLRYLGYRGLASLEFKYAAAGGRPCFIEMNPRLPWYNALFAQAGVDLARMAYFDLADPSVSASVQARNDVHWVSFKLDLAWYLASRGRRPGVWAWLRSLARASAFAWFDATDLRPFLHSTGALAVTCARRVKERLFSAKATASASARHPADGVASVMKTQQAPVPPARRWQ
jgi:D-aspartate ligase